MTKFISQYLLKVKALSHGVGDLPFKMVGGKTQGMLPRFQCEYFVSVCCQLDGLAMLPLLSLKIMLRFKNIAFLSPTIDQESMTILIFHLR